MLDVHLVLSLSLACAPGVAPETLAAVAYTESRFDPLAIGANAGPRPTRRARNPADAAQMARHLMARGANLDLGIGQINSGNLQWLDLSVEDAFDPCRNLAAAGRVLQAGFRPAPDEPPQTTLRRALSRYNTGHPTRGFTNGYVARVERAAERLGLARLAAVADQPVVHSPGDLTTSATPHRWDIFGRARFSASLAFSPAAPAWSPSQ